MGKRKTDAAASEKVGKIAEMANAYRQRCAKAQAKAAAQVEAEVRRVEGLSVLNAQAAGIDIGSRSHWVGKRPAENGSIGLPMGVSVAQRGSVSRGVSSGREDVPVARVFAAARQFDSVRGPAHSAHGEGAGADESEADGDDQRHHRRDVLKHGMTYVRQSQEEYEARVREQQVKSLHKKARALGMKVIETPAPETPTTV